MKKRVRIYKAGGNTGAYLNKTAQFLEKAQKGKIIKKVVDGLKYGQQIVMDFDKADEIAKAVKVAEELEKAKKAASIINGHSLSYYNKLVDISNYNQNRRDYLYSVLNSVKKRAVKGDPPTERQNDVLKRIISGDFYYGPKGYQLGGIQGIPDVNEMGYPGDKKEEKEYTENQLVEIIINDLNNGIDKQTISFKLTNFYGVEPMASMQLVDQTENYLFNLNDDDDEKDIVEEEDIVEEDQEEIPVEEILEENDDEEEEFANQIVTEGSVNDIYDEYKYGGLRKAQDGEETYTESYPFNATAPDLVFPSIETYLPYNISQYLDGTLDPATGNYLSNQTETDEETDEIENDYSLTDVQKEYINNKGEIDKNDVAYEDYEEGDIIDPDLDSDIIEMKKGGNYKRNKKAYVNSILKLAKKADGGEEKKSDEDPEAGDPTGAKIRKQKLNNFIGSLKKETEMFNLKQQAEQQYDQMYQQQPMMRNGGNKSPKVQRGTVLRWRAEQLKNFLTGRNRGNREDNMIYSNNYNYPIYNNVYNESIDFNGDGYADASDFPVYEQMMLQQNNIDNRRHPLYHIDVRKSNWLTGRPSKYSVDYYGASPLMQIANGVNPEKVYGKLTKKTESITTSDKSQTFDFVTKNPYNEKIDYNADGFVDASDYATYDKMVQEQNNKNIPSDDINADNIPDYFQPMIKKIQLPSHLLSNNLEVEKNKNYEQTVKLLNNNRKKSKNLTEIKRLEELTEIKRLEELAEIKRLKKLLNKEYGGFVDSNNPDLYEFNQGGIDYFNQDNIDYNNSVDTTDPYYQRGGGIGKFIKNFVPANLLSDPSKKYYDQIKRVYDPRTGKTVNVNIPNTPYSRLEINKSGFFGRPKEYTLYYGTNGQPGVNNNAEQKGKDRFCEMYPDSPNCQKNSNKNNSLSRREIRRGEQIPGRQTPFWYPKWAELETERSDPRYPYNTNKKVVIPNKNIVIPNKEVVIPNKEVVISNNIQTGKLPYLPQIKKIKLVDTPDNIKGKKQLDYYSRHGYMPNDEELLNDGPLNLPLNFNELDYIPNDTESMFNVYKVNFESEDEKKRKEDRLEYNKFLENEKIRRQKEEELPLTKEELKQKKDIQILLEREERKRRRKNKNNYKYGGDLDIYIPNAQNGFDLGDCPVGSSKNAAGDCVDFMGKVTKKRSTGSDFGNNTSEIKQPGVMNEDYKNPLTGKSPGVRMGTDGNLVNEGIDKKIGVPDSGSNELAVDIESKKNPLKLFSNDTAVSEARLQTFNAGVDIADSIRRGRENNKAEMNMYENMNSNNLYASDPSRDRGDYDTNSGLYRPDEQGQSWNSRSAQYGGYIDDYDDVYDDDQITYMSEDQIRQFMAQGGEVEFI